MYKSYFFFIGFACLQDIVLIPQWVVWIIVDILRLCFTNLAVLCSICIIYVFVILCRFVRYVVILVGKKYYLLVLYAKEDMNMRNNLPHTILCFCVFVFFLSVFDILFHVIFKLFQLLHEISYLKNSRILGLWALPTIPVCVNFTTYRRSGYWLKGF